MAASLESSQRPIIIQEASSRVLLLVTKDNFVNNGLKLKLQGVGGGIPVFMNINERLCFICSS